MKLKLKPRLKLESRKQQSVPNVPATAHGKLIQEAIAVTKELDARRRFPANKLTSAAFIRETLKADERASLKGVAKLRAALEKKPLSPHLTHTARTLARMIAGLRGPNWPSPPTAKYAGRLTTAFGTPETTAELIRFGSSTVELYCLAAALVGESNPELWGTCDDSTKHVAQVATLEARQAELFKRLEAEISGDDLNIDERDAPVTFKAAPDVPLAPRRDAGQRLVAYLMAQRQGNG